MSVSEYIEPDWIEFPDQPGIIFVNTKVVKITDLIEAKPGRIVRCAGPISDAIKYIPPQLSFEQYGFIAGMISENA